MASWPPIKGRSLCACERASVSLSCGRPLLLMFALGYKLTKDHCLHGRMALPSAGPCFLMSERCPLYPRKRTLLATLARQTRVPSALCSRGFFSRRNLLPRKAAIMPSWLPAAGFFDVRFTLESGHLRRTGACPLCANSGLMQRSNHTIPAHPKPGWDRLD
jgi:hypothetical protein